MTTLRLVVVCLLAMLTAGGCARSADEERRAGVEQVRLAYASLYKWSANHAGDMDGSTEAISGWAWQGNQFGTRWASSLDSATDRMLAVSPPTDEGSVLLIYRREGGDGFLCAVAQNLPDSLEGQGNQEGELLPEDFQERQWEDSAPESIEECLGPQAEQTPADAPNLLHSDGDLYTYESGRASDPEPECLSLPERATEVGVVGPISSDDSASEASVEAEGEGASVYELETGVVPELYIHTGGHCWAYYFVGPG